MRPTAQATLRLPGALDVRLTLSPLRHGPGDATIVLAAREAWRAARTPEGPGTEHIEVKTDHVVVTAWGPGGNWLVEHAPDLLGFDDDPETFVSGNPILDDINRRRLGMRHGRSHAVVQQLIPTIIEQKVQTDSAHSSYRRLVWATSEPSPGPAKLLLPPDPAKLAELPSHLWHKWDLEQRRADIVRGACLRAARLERLIEVAAGEAQRLLEALPGIGPWTSAIVTGAALGDRDAVPVGDFHLPHAVAWVLAGEPRATDERMLELLEPFRGRRARVIRLIKLSGTKAPRYGPRLPLRPIAGI